MSLRGTRPNETDVEKAEHEDAAFHNDVVSSFSWADLCVTVKDRTTKQPRSILEMSSGHVLPGEMVALMGPSGSGKTTLLNYLASRQVAGPGASISGEVRVNGAVQPLSMMRDISAYVEQEDALIGTLTAEETLIFAGRLALPQMNRQRIKTRASELVKSFGLSSARDTMVGTPLQKGLSGGQKRRVSVASQLITAPRLLFLDEPTSGLDSTASFEVVSHLKTIAKRYNVIIVIASIHQPSSKTFHLFDKLALLSEGRTCYFGPTTGMQEFFAQCQMAVPAYLNPAEHALDVINTDFRPQTDSSVGSAGITTIYQEWARSDHRQVLQSEISEVPTDQQLANTAHRAITWRNIPHTTLVLVHRGFLKSIRDVVAYWIRFVMYSGLAIMMGTVWLRLKADQEDIQPFINGIFFASAFMSFMAVAYVPAFLEDRSAFVKERANGLYGPLAFNLANFIVGIPYLFGITVIFSCIAYWLISFEPTAKAFFTWIAWLYLDLLAAESMVVFLSSLFPNFVVALALIAFVNGLWMSVGGFLVSPTVLNVFWRYVFHYVDYQAYVFQGMMVNEFQHRTYACGTDCHCSYASDLQNQCRINGRAVLDTYGYATGRNGKWAGILIAIIIVYRVFAGIVLWIRHT